MTDTSRLTNDARRSGWIALARVVRPQGRRGELLAEPLTSLDLSVRFAAGQLVSLAGATATEPAPDAVPISLEGHWLPLGKNAGRIVVKLAGCDSISEAERLIGHQLMVPAAELPALEADTFYVGDLIGCALFDGSEPVGEVVDVHFATSPDGKTRLPDAAPLLCVALSGGAADAEPALVPFVRAHLDAVDVAGKRISMRLPAGLLEASRVKE